MASFEVAKCSALVFGFVHILALICIPTVHSTLSTPYPYDVTVFKDEPASFMCTASSTDSLIWSKYSQGKKILYRGLTKVTPDPAKYRVTNISGVYNLTVLNAQESDAGSYSCSTEALDDEHGVNLVVISNLEATVTPSDDLQVGMPCTIECSLMFTGPSSTSYKPLTLEQHPKLGMSIGGQEQDVTGEIEVSPTSTTYQITLAITRTVAQSDVGKSIICTVTSATTPPYESMAETTWKILGGVKTTSAVNPTSIVRTVAPSVTTVNYGTTSKVNKKTQVPKTISPSEQPTSCPTVAQACNFIKLDNNNAPSGEYRIGTLFGRTIQVFCEMGLNGGGYTFIQPFDWPSLSNAELQAMFQDRTSFLVRARKSDGTQPYGILKQLPTYSNSALNLGLNTNAPYSDPVNYASMGKPFMSFGFHPPNIPASNNIQGVQCNGVNVTFNNCPTVSNSYVSLFADFNESPEATTSTTNLDFINQILTNLTSNPSGRVMPAEYFTFAEFQFGQGTCAHYTTTGRLRSTIGVLSVAVGFR